MPGALLVALLVALADVAGEARIQSDQARPSTIASAEVSACRPSHQTRWRVRSLREGKWRVRARVDRHVSDQTAVELLLAVRDGRLLDPQGVLGTTADSMSGWRPTLVNARRDAEVGSISACAAAYGHPPRSRVTVGAPRSDEESVASCGHSGPRLKRRRQADNECR